MRLIFSFLILFAMISAGPLYAACGPDLRAPFTIGEANKVIGENTPKVQVRLALSYLLQSGMESFEDRVERFETLLWAITLQHDDKKWQFTKFIGPRGITGFLGDEGYYVALTPEGRILKGQMDQTREISALGIWTGDSDKEEEIKAP